MADSPTRWGSVERLRQLLTAPSTRDGGSDEEGPQGLVITFCILASILLWFTFSMRETYQRTVEIPLRVVNLADDTALVSQPPTSARVQVEAEGIQLLRLYYNPPSIPMDASQESFDLGAAAAEAISSVRIESILPRAVSLQKDRRIARRVPVYPRVSVVPAAGQHVVGSPQVRPDSVTISGAESVVAGIDRWPTRRLQVQPEGDTVSVSVNLSDSLGNLLTFGTRSVVFSASVKEFTEGQRVVPVRVVDAPAGQLVQFEPPSVRVIYQVALDQYDVALEAEGFWAEVGLQEIRQDTTGSVVPSIHYPEGIEFREYRLDPPAVGYYFQDLFD